MVLSEPACWDLAKNKSAQVRAEACQLLSRGQESKSIETLFRTAQKDKSPLVKGYAVLALTDLALRGQPERAGEIMEFFIARYEFEPNDWVRTILLEGMVRLGDLNRYVDLEAGLYHSEYRIRLMTAAAMGVLSQRYPELWPGIEDSLRAAGRKEKHPAVKEKIGQLLDTGAAARGRSPAPSPAPTLL